MKTLLKLAIVLAFSASFANAQQYNTAIGVKGGYPGWGTLSIKHFFGAPALEVNLGGGPHHIWLQGLYEKNSELGQGFDWYWGLGGHVQIWSNGYSYYHKHNDVYYTGSRGAVDGVFGIEYTFNEIPINIAVDAGPSVNIFPYFGVDFGAAIALRFAIK